MADLPEESSVATRSGLDELVAHLREAGRFAFDTEFVSEETFEPVLCLVQVATRDRLAIVDPLAVGDLSPFWDVVLDPEVEVVMHAASEDLRICRFQTGKVPSRVFDVQIAAGLVGFGYPLSLGNLVEPGAPDLAVRGRDAHRLAAPSAQRSRSSATPWTTSATCSTSPTGSRPSSTGWGGGRGPSRSSPSSSTRSRTAPRRSAGDACRASTSSTAAAWRSPGACPTGGTRRPAAPIARSAKSLRDDLLVAIAKRQPAHRRDLEALRDFNRPHLLARGGEILAILAEAQAVPAELLPEPAERHEEGPGLTMVVNLLAAALAHCCAQHKVAPGLVGAAHDLKALVRWDAEGRPEARRPDLARGWRAEVCGQTLLDVLAGRLALRVDDPKADVPVALEAIADRPPPAERSVT